MAKAFTEGEVAVHPIIKCELASLKCGNDFYLSISKCVMGKVLL